MEKSQVRAAFGAVGASFFVFLILVLLLGSFSNMGEFGDSFGILTSLFTGLGFAGLVVTISMQQAQIRAQEKERIDEVAERRSLFNLTSSIEAYSRAQQLLANHGNVRATWIEWEAGQWPESFIDPLGSIFTSDERKKLSFQAPGLLQYLIYDDKWRSSGGSLKPREHRVQL